MKKWWIAVALVLGLLLAYVAAGPYLAIRAIGAAVQAQDAGALARQVDFPTLRASLKAQLVDAMVRGAGEDVQASALGGLALTMATGLVNGTVDGMVTPTGLAAVMQGRRLWRNTLEDFRRPATDAQGMPQAQAAPADPLQGARLHYESPSRFTATIDDERGRPVVFVLQRQGLRWKLADIRLPLQDP